MKRRVSAMLLVAALCVSLMPTNVLAAGETTSDDEGEEIAVLSIDPETDEAEESVDETEQEVALPEDTAEATSEEESVPEDDAEEETKALTGEGSFLYEDSDLTLKVKVSGNVDVPNTEKEISWDDVTMNASKLGKDSDTYRQMESYAEESSGDLGSLIVMTLSFLYGGSELDVSDCDVDVTVEPSQDLISDAMPEASDDEEGSSSVSASIVEADGDEVKELDSVTIGEDDDKDDVELNGELSEDEFGVMVLSADDPVFTVQFWANLDTIYREHHDGDSDLTVAETHTDNGAVLPKNEGSTAASAYNTSVIEMTPDGKIDSENVLTQMYADENYEFVEESTVHYMNKVEKNSDYKLVEIWKLKEGKEPDSEDKSDWDVYDIESTGDTTYSKEFTNSKEAAVADPSLILVEDDDVFRFVYDTTSADAYLDANFYDYNIGNGTTYSSASTSGGTWNGNGAAYLYTAEQGINNADNYSGSGTKLAFGNDNTGTGLGQLTWSKDGLNNLPNKYNSGNGLLGCTFGIAESLNTSTNTINFSSGINAPNLFGGDAIGKETFSNNQLVFNREGDTYTLTAVSGSNGVGVSNLDSFNTTAEETSAYTNNFWPMDNVSYSGMDVKFGSSEQQSNSTRQYFGNSTGRLPLSDDHEEHNSYFGMNFEIYFEYTEDYVGPLEYFFFGDDDMWVFLDDQLVIDIGGVHSTVGEHVDLWDYLKNDTFNEDGIASHTLSVFYTERGASGSTCFIQYTLPEVSSVTPVDDASNLIIEKEVEGAATDQEFEFTLNLKDAGGTELSNQYSYIISNETGLFVESGTIKSGETFKLRDGWNIEIRNLPNGSVATVTETREPGYTTTYEVGKITTDGEGTGTENPENSGSGLTTSGTVSDSGTTYIKFINSSDTPVKDVDVDGDGEYGDSGVQAEVGDTLEYKIDYVNNTGETVTVTITDVLDKGLDFVSAENGGTYDESTRTITWVLENVEADAPISVTFKATINENALETNEIKNTAKVKVNGDPEVETEPVYTPVPDKDVDADEDGKYGDSGEEVAVGDVLEYKIDYQNSYEQPATVTITDVLDDGLTYVSSDPEAEVSTDSDGHTVLTWTIEDVEAHTGGSVTFKAEVNRKALKENKVTNTATVEIDNHSAVTNEVDNPVPDKDVDADGDGKYGDSGEDVKVGDTLTYIIHYDNEYEEPAIVTITDVLDEGLDYVEGSASDNGVYDPDTRTITWVINDVGAHTNGSVTFQATVNKSALIEDEVNNVASVQVNDDPAVNTNVVHNPVPDKDVDANGDGEYGDSGLQVKVGDTLTYKIDYFNGYELDDEGYTDPATVTITDVLDEGLDFVEASDGGVYDDATRTITWTIENVTAQSGGSVTFKATVNEKALVKNEVDNTATVQINEDPSVDTNTVYNPVPEKDEDADEDEKYGDSGRAVEVGTKITFTIKYYNGYDDAEDVIITDVLDKGLTYVEGSATNGGVYDEETRTITWTISNVEAHTGGSVQFSAVVNENALTGHQVENKASVQIGNHPAVDTNTVYNPLTSKDVDINPDDGLDYGDNGKQVNVGDTLTYIVYYMNSYDNPATVTITDVLDDGLDFVKASDNGTYDASTRTITWTLENVPGRESIEDDLYVTFEATVNENALVKHEVDNTATVQVNNDPSVQTNIVYNPVPEKDVDADGNGEYSDSGELVQIGDTLTYKIDYFNGYDVAADVVITDTLDQGLTYVSSDPEAAYDESTQTLTWTLSGVEALTGGSVTFKATVNSKALENENLEIDNEAYVKVGDDPEVKTNPVDNEVLVIEVSGEKVWDDDDNEYNSRPGSITIHLLADGEPAKDYDGNEITATVTPDAEGKWTWSFTDLPKYKTVVDASTGETTKEEITYTITEDAIPDYTQDGITGDMNDGFVITNKLVEPKISKRVHEDDYERKEESGEGMHDGEDTDGDGEGTWDDADNNQEVTYHLKVTEIKNVLNLIIHDYLEDGLDFEPDTVEITLYDNGDETELVEDTDFTVTQDGCSDPECSMDGCTFEIKFKDDNPFADVSSDAYLAVTYKALTDTHEQDYDDYEDDILNATYMTYGLSTTSLRRSAVAYAETDLFGFGIYKYSMEDGEEVALADAEFTLERDGMYATFETEYDEDTGDKYYMVSGWEEDASAAGTLTSGEDGVIRIDGLDDDTYTITETKAPTGYEIVDETITVVIDEDGNVTVDGDTGSKEVVTGHEVNVENSLILTSVEGTKTWDDADNQDGKRPESITINLLADGGVIDTKTVTEADGWSWSFTDLPMYKDGVLINYQIVEYPIPDDYSASLDGSNVTNKYTPGKTSVAVTKVWDDQGDVDGLRPESVTVELYKNGEATGDRLTLSEDNNWIGSFTELDEYTGGVKNEYTVKEVAVEGYTTEITGDAESVYVITNKHTSPEKSVDTDGDGTFEDDGEMVHVGDVLTYQIKYYNYKDEPATVTITDTLDYALDFVSADNSGKYDESTRTITWTIKGAPAQEWGTVTFKAKVNDIALLEEQIENTATVKIGNDKAIDTNVVKNPTPDDTEGNGQPGTTGGGNGGPKTNDTNNIALWIALLVAAMAAIIVALRMRKRS